VKGLSAINPKHIYEVRPRKDHRGFDLISDVLPFGRLWYDTPDKTTSFACRQNNRVKSESAP
jgi:hypothetical protein